MIRTSHYPPRPAAEALALDGVASANFWSASGLWTGVAHHEGVGIEFDVRQVAKRRWYASDDDGVCHYGRSMSRALRRAIEANR